ncbi:MAG TPA: arginyltransferase [Tepidisphaeraceae bacterium]|jgi:arginine-tRNA-protein transferase|nr:arginyltransferase [Tepidisphaeraceae bacterium]
MDESNESHACPFPAWHPPLNVRLTVLPEHPCAYLPGRMAQSRAFWVEGMPAKVYHDFMNAGFRRSGELVYQPICKGCRECLPIRVPIATFKPSKSQRRCFRQNQDVCVTAGRLESTDEKWELYQRYMQHWHKADADDRAGFESFLYESPVDTLEFCYRDGSGKLLAVGICDMCDESLSSVYFYFDPAEAHRGLGTFGALYELNFARDQGIPYYYLGYWIDQCPSMRYKSMYRVHEILYPDNVWRAGNAEKADEDPAE